MRIQLALFLLSPLLAGCGGTSPTAPGEGLLSFATVVKVSTSGFESARRTVVRSEEEWAEIWRTVYAHRTPVPALPEVDFGRESLILAAAGTRSNGCYSIAVSRARLTVEGAVELEVVETSPGPSCVCTQALTQPVHVVRLEPASADATFVERRAQLRC